MSLPCNIEAEKKTLGAMIRDPEAIIRVRDILQPHDFHQPSHQIIYQSILDITNRGSSVDLMILHDDLERKKQVDHAGGLLYLTEIVHGVATSVNIEYHAAIVLEKSQRRQLIRHCSEITEKAQAGEEDVESLTSLLQDRLQKISARQSGPQSLNQLLGDVLTDTRQRIEDAWEGRPPRRFLSTGFHDLDRLTGGIDQGEMVILAAQPSLGKTALACSIALNVAQSGPVVFFSLETDAPDILRRMIAIQAGFSFHDLSEGRAPANALTTLEKTAATLQSLPIYIDDSRGISPDQIYARSEKIKMQAKGLKLVIVDYLQLMNIPYLKGLKKYEQVTELSHQCQILPGKLKCPLLLLSQLSRESAKESRAPRMSDLRDSGAIEQDAHQIWFISLPKDEDKALPGPRNLIVEKNKKGPTGLIQLQFTPEHFAFHNLDRYGEPDYFNHREEDAYVPF